MLFGAVVFLTHNRIVGWEPGYDQFQPDIKGWVSSHALGIIYQATPENAFVGRTENAKWKDFDRYYVILSGSMNSVLSIVDHLSSRMYIHKLYKNLLFIVAILINFMLYSKLIHNGPAANGIAIPSMPVNRRCFK